MVIGHVRNHGENRHQQHRENRPAHVATIGAVVDGGVVGCSGKVRAQRAA